MIVITGATGALGALVIDGLLQKIPAGEIIAAVRTPSKAVALSAKGVQVREADYSRPETLAGAFKGATKVLLISGNEIGQRVPQHKAVIDAAKTAGVQLLAYTSLLHADASPLALAREHAETEKYLVESGIPFTLLRNGWYVENLTASIQSALQQGAFLGASKEGQIAAATRTEFAAAAVAVLTGDGHENKIYELAGDTPFTRAELAAEVSRQAGKTIGYNDLPEAEYEKILSSFLPAALAHIIADAEAHAAAGALNDDSHLLSKLIGHKTQSLAEVVADVLKNS